MSLLVTKEYTWDMAHMLEGHLGLCKNVHGHTYKMHVTVASRDKENEVITEGPAFGMVCDFKDLKTIVSGYIVEPLDHAFMYNMHSKDPVEQKIASVLVETGRKTVPVEYRPTAENMAKHFYAILDKAFADKPFELVEVIVWETPTSFASYKK